MSRSSDQRGFTLIELMTASIATAVVILAATAFMLKSLSWYDEISSKIEMNRHARETFDLFAFGGVSSSTGKDLTKNVYGINGHNKPPPGPQRTNGALSYTSNQLTLTPDTFASMTVTCHGPGNPIPDCSGGTKAVQGWLGSDVTIKPKAPDMGNGWIMMTITITDPFEAQRATAPATFTDIYTTAFVLNRDENDP